MFRAVVIASVVWAAAASADVDPKFAKLRDSAEAIEGLGNFLDKYVGDCGTDADCKKNTEAFRTAANAKKFYMIITEDSVSNLSMGTYDPGSQTFTLNLTPFFPASNSAITGGAPTHTDANGNPVMPFMTLKGTVSEGGNAQSVQRMVAMKTLRLQVVFSPQGTWSLPKKGSKEKMIGVKAKIDAILVSVGRTGEQIGLYVAK
ncbi:MAG: hypothetical protein IPJ65_19360 [Archangiaceae bacterium]|nr:hypothetical protein [Archangiaceae bacterium]